MGSQVPLNPISLTARIDLEQYSVRHFPFVSCMVVDLPGFSAVRYLTSWFAYMFL